MEERELLYKYRYFDKDGYHLRIISDLELYFASPEELNDPFDCKITVRYDLSDRRSHIKSAERHISKKDPSIHPNKLKKEAEKLVKEFLKNKERNQLRFEERHSSTVDKKVGVCSLSRNRNHSSMWSLYSNLHKGFLIVFDKKILEEHFIKILMSNHEKKGFPLTFGIDVEYQESTPKITLDLLDSEDRMNFLKLFSTKSEDWRYENEFRFFCYNKSSQIFKIPKESIVRVIAGIQISPKDFQKLENICKQAGVNLNRAEKDPKFFKPVY